MFNFMLYSYLLSSFPPLPPGFSLSHSVTSNVVFLFFFFPFPPPLHTPLGLLSALFLLCNLETPPDIGKYDVT